MAAADISEETWTITIDCEEEDKMTAFKMANTATVAEVKEKWALFAGVPPASVVLLTLDDAVVEDSQRLLDVGETTPGRKNLTLKVEEAQRERQAFQRKMEVKERQSSQERQQKEAERRRLEAEVQRLSAGLEEARATIRRLHDRPSRARGVQTEAGRSWVLQQHSPPTPRPFLIDEVSMHGGPIPHDLLLPDNPTTGQVRAAVAAAIGEKPRRVELLRRCGRVGGREVFLVADERGEWPAREEDWEFGDDGGRLWRWGEVEEDSRCLKDDGAVFPLVPGRRNYIVISSFPPIKIEIINDPSLAARDREFLSKMTGIFARELRRD